MCLYEVGINTVDFRRFFWGAVGAAVLSDMQVITGGYPGSILLNSNCMSQIIIGKIVTLGR